MIEKQAKIATKIAQRKAEETGLIDELEINPKNEDFLKGIDLGDSSDAESEADEAGQDAEYQDESEAKWSKAFIAVSVLENLFLSCDSKQVIQAYSQELG